MSPVARPNINFFRDEVEFLLNSSLDLSPSSSDELFLFDVTACVTENNRLDITILELKFTEIPFI